MIANQGDAAMRMPLTLLIAAAGLAAAAAAAPAAADGSEPCIRLPGQAQIIIVPPGGCTGPGVLAGSAAEALGVSVLRFGTDAALPPPPPRPERRGGVAIVISIGGGSPDHGHHHRRHHW
jgi:hypothetical protein